MNEKKNFIGIKILAILFILCGLPYSLLIRNEGYFFLIIIPLLYLVSGVGVLRLKNWARLLLLWINIPFNLFFLIFCFSICLLFPLPEAMTSATIWGIFLLSSAILLILLTIINQIYFTRSKIKEQFK